MTISTFPFWSQNKYCTYTLVCLVTPENYDTQFFISFCILPLSLSLSLSFLSPSLSFSFPSHSSSPPSKFNFFLILGKFNGCISLFRQPAGNSQHHSLLKNLCDSNHGHLPPQSSLSVPSWQRVPSWKWRESERERESALLRWRRKKQETGSWGTQDEGRKRIFWGESEMRLLEIQA